jgi:hypothetical protein
MKKKNRKTNAIIKYEKLSIFNLLKVFPLQSDSPLRPDLSLAFADFSTCGYPPQILPSLTRV